MEKGAAYSTLRASRACALHPVTYQTPRTDAGHAWIAGFTKAAFCVTVVRRKAVHRHCARGETVISKSQHVRAILDL